MSAKKRVALVIGSGGIKCAAAAGLWRVLQEEGIAVDSVVGCSGGSMYGALIANHTDVQIMQEWSRTLWTSNIMQGYTENLKATKDGSLRFNERSGLVDDSVMMYPVTPSLSDVVKALAARRVFPYPVCIRGTPGKDYWPLHPVPFQN